MKITSRLTLSEILPTRTPASKERSQDLFSSTAERTPERYQCYWPDSETRTGSLPSLIAPASGDLDTLFADVATFYSDFSPLTAYVHVVEEDVRRAIFAAQEERAAKEATLLGERARPVFVALAVAEALTSAFIGGGDEEDVSYPLCRRTLSFALARTSYLYPRLKPNNVAARWMQLRELTSMEAATAVSAAISFICTIMDGGGDTSSNSLDRDLFNLFRGSLSPIEFSETLSQLYPGAGPHIDSLAAHFDGRVPAFEKLAGTILTQSKGTEIDSLAIAYFANQILPGSFSHTRLLSRRILTHPAILIWYGLFAAVSKDFDFRSLYWGLGQKLLRDIEAVFQLSDAPTADISIDEATVLARIGLRARTIKPTQPRTMLVSLLPGVEIQARFPVEGESRQRAAENRLDQTDQILASLAERDSKLRRLLDDAQSLLAGQGVRRGPGDNKPSDTSTPAKKTKRSRGS